MSKYLQLLDELKAEREKQDTMIKSLSTEDNSADKSVSAAAADGATGDAGEGDEGAGEEDKKKEGEENAGGEGGQMAKSLVLENGEEVIDATEMLKSLEAQFNDHDDLLLKALPQIGGMFKAQNEVIAKQGEMIKSLTTRMEQLAGQGRGRKAVIAMVEKNSGDEMVKSQQQQQSQGMTQGEFMLKANNAFDKKIISGAELNTIDVCLRNGFDVDAGLVAKVAQVTNA